MAKTFRFRSKYLNDYGTVEVANYQNQVIAIRLVSPLGEPLATPTVNLEAYGERPDEGNVFIKTWAGNEGIIDSLIEHGIVSEPLRTVKIAHGNLALECKLTISREDARFSDAV